MKVIVNPYGNVQVFKKGVLEAKVVEYKDRKCLLVNDEDKITGDNYKLIREVEGSLRCTRNISEEKVDTLKVLDDSEFTLERFMYVVTEENTYDIKEDLKKAGAKWHSEYRVWYFEQENNTFKNEKVYVI